MIRRQIPLVLTFIVGIIVSFDWFIKWQPLQDLTSTIMNFQIVMSAFMLGFAGVNLLILHSSRIRRNLSDNKMFDAILSVVLLGCLALWTIIGIAFGYQHPTYKWLYDTFNLPLSSTAYAATLFYLSSATYRVLRARSAETTLLLIVGVITILANMPLVVTYLPILTAARAWIADILVKSSYRAITIGVGLGGIMTGVRTLLAMETGYLGGVEE
jgi:hypothetical protein